MTEFNKELEQILESVARLAPVNQIEFEMRSYYLNKAFIAIHYALAKVVGEDVPAVSRHYVGVNEEKQRIREELGIES